VAGRAARARAARGLGDRRGRGVPARRRSVRLVEAAMSVLGALENGLFALGQVLRFPVSALLWLCVAAKLVMTGRRGVDFLARRRERRGFDAERWLERGGVLTADEPRKAELPLPLRRMLDRKRVV